MAASQVGCNIAVSSFQEFTVSKIFLFDHGIDTLRGFIMAILVFRSATRLRLSAGANAHLADEPLQAKRIVALTMPAGDAVPGMAAPDALRRPGMAARWKGLNRLAFAG